MPEGHVIHGLARELNRHFAGRALAVTSPQGRFAAEAETLNGVPFEQARAFGKHLFLLFDAPKLISIHLGLIGTFRIEPDHPPVGQVRLRLEDPQATDPWVADLRGPQWCRLVDPEDMHKVLATGADPLLSPVKELPASGEHRVQPRAAQDYHGRHALPPGMVEGAAAQANAAAQDAAIKDALTKARRSRRSVASLLMDQKIFPGVGNIYRAEVLFRAGIDPTTPGAELSATQWQWIWDDLVVLMHAGVRVGHIDTVRPEHSPEAMGRAARRDDHGGEVYVYRRAAQPCLVCGSQVRTTVVEGRNLFWCPGCQR